MWVSSCWYYVLVRELVPPKFFNYMVFITISSRKLRDKHQPQVIDGGSLGFYDWLTDYIFSSPHFTKSHNTAVFTIPKWRRWKRRMHPSPRRPAQLNAKTVGSVLLLSKGLTYIPHLDMSTFQNGCVRSVRPIIRLELPTWITRNSALNNFQRTMDMRVLGGQS